MTVQPFLRLGDRTKAAARAHVLAYAVNVSELLHRLRELPDVEEAPSQFHGETAFWVDGREFVHLQGSDEIEIRLTRRLIGDLDDARVWRRSRTSDWVGVRTEHTELVLDLAGRALEANRREP